MEDRLREEDQHCPVCGYYCLGRGGYGCIDKPSMIKNTRATDLLIEEMARALAGYLNNDGARGYYWVIEKNKYRELCEQALQKYREREQKPAG